MRRYVRHPSSMSVGFHFNEAVLDADGVLIDVAAGGLSLYCGRYVSPGEFLQVQITTEKPLFEAAGKVVWCQTASENFQLGLNFQSIEESYALRMVTQMCQIEAHRQRQMLQGRELTSDEAAMEWIDLFAATFPPMAS